MVGTKLLAAGSRAYPPSEPCDSHSNQTKLMYIAVEGCCHGELDKIYNTIHEV